MRLRDILDLFRPRDPAVIGEPARCMMMNLSDISLGSGGREKRQRHRERWA